MPVLVRTDKQKTNKSENLSIRLDPKTKFILDFLARIRGQTITTVVERAIKEVADREKIGGDGYNDNGRTWLSFWDPSEGVRLLKLLADEEYPTSFDEDEIRAFTLDHWQFFYQQPDGKSPRRAYVEILWPSIDTFLGIWRDRLTEDYWAAGRAMSDALLDAQVQPPEWPGGSSKSPASPLR